MSVYAFQTDSLTRLIIAYIPASEKGYPYKNCLKLRTAISGIYTKTKEHQLFQNVLCHSSSISVSAKIKATILFLFLCLQQSLPQDHIQPHCRVGGKTLVWLLKKQMWADKQTKVKSSTKSWKYHAFQTCAEETPFPKFLSCVELAI